MKHATDGTKPCDPPRMGQKVLLLAIILVPLKGGGVGILWEGGVDYGSVASSGEEGGIFRRDG